VKRFAVLDLIIVALFLVASAGALAVEPKNPVTLCERFISPQTKSACEKRLDKLGPDWYLASVCEKQFEDSLFFDCLQLSATKNFSPIKLDKCDQVGIPDMERINCLIGIAEKNSGMASEAYQDGKPSPRKPANSK
jgi:hypothetical protein